jgi:hypothetical protein
MVVLWQGRHRSAGLGCTWWRHSLFHQIVNHTIWEKDIFFLAEKKIVLVRGKEARWKGSKRDEKGQKKNFQFFFIARAVVRWPDRTTARAVHVRSCAASLCQKATCYPVMMLAKVLRTQVHMSSRSSVQNHWHFDHYLQSLCLPVLHAARNRTKIVPKSFPMRLFLWSTVWSSLLILRISWHASAAALNSWPSRLWSRNSSPPPSPSPHSVLSWFGTV